MNGMLSTLERVCACMAAAFTALLATHAFGADANDASEGAPVPTTVSLSADDLTKFLDELVPRQLERRNIAGAVVAAVLNDQILLSRGYGYANVREQIPMSDTTLVRAASVTKPFVALAVAQLVEQGKLELDRDVNDDLDFDVPTPAGGVPVTLRSLLTHRAGYENFLKDLFGAGTTPPPLGEWLRKSQPRRLFPHGDVSAYSNYGYGVAGYIVERVSGMKFEEYMMQHILQPLGMQHATFAQPLPFTAQTALGYPNASAPPSSHFETITPAPAGALSVNAADMALFLKAMTTSSGGNRVRLPAGAAEFELLGLEEDFAAGNRFISKHGLALSFVSLVAWLPEQRFGLFVSYNSATGARAPVELLEAIAGRYFAHAIPRPTEADAAVNASDLAGVYQASQRADSTLLRFNVLVSGQLVVTAQADGSLRVNRDTDAYAPAERGVFRAPSGQELRFAKRASSDLWTFRWTAVPLPIEFERAPWYLDARILMPALPIAVMTIAVALLCWPVATFMRRRQQRSFGNTPGDRRDYVALRLVLALHLIVFGAFALLTAQFNDLTRLNASIDPWLVGLFGLAWLSIVATPLTFWTAFRFWRDRVGSLWTRLYHSLLAASAAFIAWFWFMFRIAGTKLNF